jgi:hypothetical protein
MDNTLVDVPMSIAALDLCCPSCERELSTNYSGCRGIDNTLKCNYASCDLYDVEYEFPKFTLKVVNRGQH